MKHWPESFWKQIVNFFVAFVIFCTLCIFPMSLFYPNWNLPYCKSVNLKGIRKPISLSFIKWLLVRQCDSREVGTTHWGPSMHHESFLREKETRGLFHLGVGADCKQYTSWPVFLPKENGMPMNSPVLEGVFVQWQDSVTKRTIVLIFFFLKAHFALSFWCNTFSLQEKEKKNWIDFPRQRAFCFPTWWIGMQDFRLSMETEIHGEQNPLAAQTLP